MSIPLVCLPLRFCPALQSGNFYYNAPGEGFRKHAHLRFHDTEGGAICFEVGCLRQQAIRHSMRSGMQWTLDTDCGPLTWCA